MNPIVTVKGTDAQGRTFQKQLPLDDCQIKMCENCGGEVFQSGVKVIRIPALLVGAPNDLYSQMPVLFCSQCGWMLQDNVT